jgi:uncharacterized membrane protein
MPTLLRLLQLLAMVVWVGGLVFFAFVLAPTAFATYPTAHEAGLIVGASLRVFDVVGLVCGALFLLATGVLFAQAPLRIRGRYEMQFLLAAVMLLATAYIHFNILPSMDRDRDRANGDITSVSADHPARIHFDKLHKRSERVEGAVLLLGLAIVVLMAREQVPVSVEDGAARS